MTPAYINSFHHGVLDNYTKSTWLHLLLIYLVVFFLGLICMLPMANRHLDHLTQQALNEIEASFATLQNDLVFLTEEEATQQDCRQLTTRLRSEVFQSDVAKEVGVFRPSGEVYCTSNAVGSSFYLYQTIMDRLEEHGVTLSYTKSKMSQDRSAFLLFTGQSKYGVSIVIPPRYIVRLIEGIPEAGVYFDIEIISRNITKADYDEKIFDTVSLASTTYPLKVRFYASYQYYLSYYISYAWVGLLLASLLSTYYLVARQRKIEGSSLETALKGALSSQLLDVYFQPIVDSRTQRIVGCESLVRWKDPVQGYISPGIFIPLAEKLNLIDEVTQQVMGKVLTLLSEKGELFEGRYISVNISRGLILREDFIERAVNYFADKPDIASKLVFEVTEEINFSATELEVLQVHLQRIARLGIRVAIDDFGTGYSGLNFIRQYPFDIFKIDRVFVNNLSNDSTIIPLLKSMKMISQTLNMSVIVEGVEEAEQVEILAELGFHNIQGFHFFKPMPRNELVKLLG